MMAKSLAERAFEYLESELTRKDHDTSEHRLTVLGMMVDLANREDPRTLAPDDDQETPAAPPEE